MMNRKTGIALVWPALVVLAEARGEIGLPIIPKPARVERADGRFIITQATAIRHDGAGLPAAQRLADDLRQATGLPLPVRADGAGGISLALDPALQRLGNEGYRLAVSEQGAVLGAATVTGLLWGAQTLRQLVSAEGALACMTIEDQPRFGWRGLMLDCSRTFQSIDYLKKTVDRMSFYKLNVLHLHLTDDQGWRLEIRTYPELTAKGARFAAKYNEPPGHEGFYTQAQMRDLVAYAAARAVTIVPEIEMPGHSLAALSVFPQLSCAGGSFEIFPFFKGPNITRNVFCAGNDETFAFFEHVLSEVAELFPSTFVHVGGDEVPKDSWRACPKCQARMKAEGLKNEHELQSWFIRRAEAMLAKHGKRLIGWDEILEGGLAPNAAVMSWRGTQGGVAAAKAGHDVVMSPTSHCYFDYPYKSIDTAKAFSFEPVPAGFSSEEAKHVLGLQANFWSHIDREPALVDRQLYPRLLGIAERGWSRKEDTDGVDFARRAQLHLAHLDRLGVAYDHGPLSRTVRADGVWTPALVSETYAPLTWNVTPRISGPGRYRVVMQYTQGACRLGIEKVELLADGRVVAEDVHRGVTGASDEGNVYRLKLDTHRPGAKYELRASAQSEGGRDSNGVVSIDKE